MLRLLQAALQSSLGQVYYQLWPARGEPLEDITKVVSIQVSWRLQQLQEPFGIGLADQLQRDAVLPIRQPN